MYSTNRNKVIVIISVLVIAAGLIGWSIGHKNKSNQSSTMSQSSASNSGVRSLASYILPAGWTENGCPNAPTAVYIMPIGKALNCETDPRAPIALLTDPQNTTDCSQLKDVQNVKKHTCISLYIDGHKSLKSFTQTAQSSSYDYYINTGHGVVLADYTYTSTNDYQTGFEQLVKSIRVKS